jgi:ABC-type long-subunit fatty acid transport system fused permease/ATPase subunit
MFKEFFAPDPKRACGGVTVAWGGLLLVILHAFLHGYVKWRLNKFFGSFYNVLQTSGSIAVNASATTEDWEAGGDAVMRELIEFCKIAAVAVAVMPFSKLLRSLWCLEWRIALSKFYLASWGPNHAAIEGASQRTQEDAFRFAKGIEMCLTIGLDVIISLVVFVPVLVELGGKVECPSGLDGFFIFGDAWLAALALTAAISGFVLTFILGSRLVGLEVSNQKCEADFRTQLVKLEVSPSTVCDAHHTVDESAEIPSTVLLPPAKKFTGLIQALLTNYRLLFLNFLGLNTWLALFDQTFVIVPYLLTAPRLFDPDPTKRILLGTLMQVSNSFDRVFTALNTISENWAAVNEFRSVLVRLRQFEANLYNGVPHPSRTATSSGCLPSRGVPAEVVSIELVESEEVVSQTRV